MSDMDIVGSCPTEIATAIFGYLSFKDLLSCQLVSKTWYDLVDNNALWKRFDDPTVTHKEPNFRKDFRWLSRRPCDYKLRMLNHKRILKNWRENRYEKFIVGGRWVEAIAYDGKTLVINNILVVDVYRVEKGSMRPLQSLKYKGQEPLVSVTNTEFIVTKYQQFLLVYKLNKCNKYKTMYMLDWGSSENGKSLGSLEMVSDHKRTRLKRKLNECTHPYWSYWMCLLRNTLYIYVSHIEVMFAWDLIAAKSVLSIKSRVQSIYEDEERVYVTSERTLTTYDDAGRLLYAVDSDRRVDKTMLNRNIILTISWDYVFGRGGVTVWEKCTGREIRRTVLTGVTVDSVLDPKKDVLYDIVDIESERKEVYAIDLREGTKIWSTVIGESSILGDLHSIVAGRILLFSTYSGNVFDIFDTESGQFLYSLYGIDDYSVFTAYDLLIYVHHTKRSLVIHIYS